MSLKPLHSHQISAMHSQSALAKGWESAWDGQHQRWYFFNRSTGVTQWEPPDAEGSQVAAQVVHATSQQGHSKDAKPQAHVQADGAGWYYVDPKGATQGPFTLEQLSSWRAHLPMDLLLWWQHPAAGGSQGASKRRRSQPAANAAPAPAADQSQGAGASRDGRTGSTVGPQPTGKASTEQQQQGDGLSSHDAGPRQGEEEEDEDDLPPVELAQLLGDWLLLKDWREHNTHHLEAASQAASSRGYPVAVAPPAPVWEHWLIYGSKPTGQGQKAQGQGSSQAEKQEEEEEEEVCGWKAGDASAYAQAVLEGLPEHDEAKVLARLAEQSGKSLDEVVHFSRTASQAASGDLWKSSAEYNPYRRRLQVAGTEEGAGPGALYRELSSWCDPEQLEASLREAAARRGAPLPPSVWKQLKERKLAAKKRARTQALLS